LEDLLVEAYTCRGTAYAESNDLAAAEADLLVMVNQQKTLGHDNGVGINELAWLRLGDFYRKYAKDDRKALDAYAHVIDRTYKPWYVPKPIPKPVLTGDSQTLRDAVQASSDILRKQGKEAEAIKLHASLLKPRAEALGGMGKKAEAIAVFGEITDDRSIFTPGREAWEKRLHALPDDFRTNLVKKIASETALTVGTQRFLIQATGDVDAKGRATALRAILAFAPLDTTIKWLDEAEAEARKKAVRAKIEPLISRLRSLAQARQWQALINEFKDADLAGWQDAALAGEALYWRGTAYAALKNGTSAAADLKQAVQLAPGNSSWWVAVAENYRANLNDEQQALATFLQYLKEFGVNNNYGENLRVALMAAEMLRSQGRKGEALDVLKRYDLAKLPSVDYRNQFEQAIKACAKQEH
jgi:tetratricopeptide (TPR) repeat protein